MKRILEYLPILTICFLYFSFCSMYGYYRQFNVDISAFISTQDIILSFFPSIVLFSSTISAAISQQLYSNLQPSTQGIAQNNTTKEKVGNWFRKRGFYLIIFYYVPILPVYILAHLFKWKPYSLQEFNIVVDVVFLMLLYIVISWSDRRELIINNTIVLSIFLVAFVGIRIQTYRSLDALRVKDAMPDKNTFCSFTFAGKNIRTSDSVILIGQTANWIFLYHVKDSTTSIYPISKIDEFRIK